MRTTADYTASVLAGFDRQGNFYIADVLRKRMEYPEQRRFIIDRMRRANLGSSTASNSPSTARPSFRI